MMTFRRHVLIWVFAGIGWFLLLVIALAIYWDALRAMRGQQTISAWLASAAHTRPWLPVLVSAPVFLLCGILIGHFWFPQKG